MADSKITALAALTAADPVNDMFPVVDVSDTSMAASGTTKRISANNILSSSPTASGALTVTGLVTAGSATITGALDAARLNVTAATIPANGVYLGSANNLSFSYASTLGMTLNSTGLGVGYTPSGSADKLGSAATLGVVATGSTADLNFRNSSLTAIQRIRYTDGTGVLTIGSATGTSYTVELGGNTTTRAVTIDASSNVGIGVTPSTPWATNRRALQIGGTNSGAIALNGTSGSGELFFNSFFNSSSQNICVVTGGTGKYDFNVSTVGCHTWSVGTGTAATAFTFTPAMVLDASGNLILQSSATPATLATNGQLTVNATSNTNLRFSYRGSDGTTRVANLTLA